MKPVRRCNPYGPEPGKWTFAPTVAETIRKEQKRLKELADALTAWNTRHWVEDAIEPCAEASSPHAATSGQVASSGPVSEG